MDEAGVDFAFAAWRENGRWTVTAAPEGPADTLAGLAGFARGRPEASDSVGFVSVAGEFFVCLRIQGARTRVLLSDVAAALDWPIAEEAAGLLGVSLDEIEDVDAVQPAGDLRLLADLGVPPEDLDMLCGDPELYPDEQIGSLAEQLGFGDQVRPVLATVRT